MRGIRLTAAMFAAGMLAASPCAAVANASPGPPSAPLCQILHQSVQPALDGLMKNDGLLEAADRAFVSTSENDRISLHSVTESLSRNLTTVTRLLGQKLPEDANPTTHGSEQLMKSRLEAVASAQNDALNMIEGYLQAQEMARARNDSAAGGQDGGFSDDQALHADFHNKNDPAKPFVDTRVGSPTRLLQIARAQIGNLEDSAGTAIMAAVKVCNSP